ncbi:hypothetical protein E5288_WYG011287 [Bos mutus]|uniref:Uncharacterized protein n=1 Tax=Bos mutus TaxID=72004 RepID=A0A6B0RB66_9CETA|nr:hypothetical protein [Bos mutus]
MSRGQSSHCPLWAPHSALDGDTYLHRSWAKVCGDNRSPGALPSHSNEQSNPACRRTHAHPPLRARPLATHGVPNNRRSWGPAGRRALRSLSGTVRQPLEREHPAPVSPSGLSSLCPDSPDRAREHAPESAHPAEICRWPWLP